MARRKDKKDRKKFKDRVIGGLLARVAPDLLRTVGDQIPVVSTLLKVKDLVFGKKERGEINETDFAEFNRLYELELQELDMRLKDTADARAMQVAALQSGDKFAGRYSYILASVIILAAIGFGVALMFVDLPEKNRRLVEMFADVFLFAGALQVINYFYGSSAGSKRKTDIMGNK